MNDDTVPLSLGPIMDSLKQLAARRVDLAREYVQIAVDIGSRLSTLGTPSDIVQVSALASDCVVAALALEPILPDSGILGNDVRSCLETTLKTLTQNGQFDRAAQLLERVIAVSPAWVPVAVRLYMNLADADMSSQSIPGVRELNYVQRAGELDPKIDITHLATRHADLAASAGTIEDGAAHLRRALEIFEKHNPQGRGRRAVLPILSGLFGTGTRSTGYLALAYRAARAGNFVQAENLLLESLRIAVILDHLSRFLHARTAGTVYDSFIDLADKRGDKKSAARMRQNQKALSHRVDEFARPERK